jgi:hypothetical protein
MEAGKMTKSSWRLIAALLFGGLLVVVCYFFVDRQVAWFMHAHRVYSDEFLRWPPLISDWLSCVVIGGIAGVAVWRIWRPGGSLQTLLVAIAANLIATTAIKTLLKGTFGRSPGWAAIPR